MTPNVRLSAVEYEKKKTAIASVIDFNDASDIKYSKIKLFKHFGVSVMTGYIWFPVSSDARSRGGRPKIQNIKKEHESPGLKRTHSEDPAEETFPIKADSPLPPAPLRQNPVRNNGRGRKRLKALVEDLAEQASIASTPPPPISPPSTADTSSPPLPQQLLTPPKRKITQAKKGRASNSGHHRKRTEDVTDLKHEDVDDDIIGEV
jgi:hypothetical protein